ncbi:MAG TPA: hypothetical protein VN442_00330 [Bryobacteraceae bacterium]|nr:hypothetical protein [Bryobacteraceae bacterium]
MKAEDIRRKRRRFEADNRAASEIILCDPERHGGPDSLMVRWARAVAEQQQQQK